MSYQTNQRMANQPLHLCKIWNKKLHFNSDLKGPSTKRRHLLYPMPWWAVFINDLPDQLQNLVCTLLFADDVQLAPLDEGDAGTLQMIKALHISTSWANKWRLVWSLIKSVYLCSKISVNLSDISLYGTPLKQVKTTKYLGLHYSHDGT